MKGGEDGPGLVTKSEYARLKGWRPSYVTKLIAQQRLVLSPDGKRVDVAASDRRLAETSSVDRAGVREHHARARAAEAASPPELPLGASAEPPAPSVRSERNTDPTYEAYNKARADREASLAAMARMDQRKREGELVEAAQVRAAAERLAGIIAKGFAQIRPRIGAVIGAEADPFKRELLLDVELRKIQGEFADEVLKLFQEQRE